MLPRTPAPHDTPNQDRNRLIRAVIFDYGNTLVGIDPSMESRRADYADVVARPGAERLARRLVGFGALEESASAGFVERFLDVRETNRARADATGDEITAATSLAETLRAVGAPALPQERIAEALLDFFSTEEERIVAIPGAGESLAWLRARGVPTALLSNATDGAYVSRVAARFGWREWLDPFLVSADLGVRKPRREAFEAVLRAWPFRAGEVAMVGDSLRHDVQGADALGLATVHFTWIEHPADAAAGTSVRPRYRVSTHEALRAALLPALD